VITTLSFEPYLIFKAAKVSPRAVIPVPDSDYEVVEEYTGHQENIVIDD